MSKRSLYFFLDICSYNVQCPIEIVIEKYIWIAMESKFHDGIYFAIPEVTYFQYF